MAGKYLLGNMLSAIYNKNCFYDVPVNVVYSNLCAGVLVEMQKYGYINKFDVVEKENKKSIDVYLRTVNGVKNINSFKLISKPGRRIYNSVDELKKKVAYNPYSLILVSTSKGIMAIADAVEQSVGGEVLCEIF